MMASHSVAIQFPDIPSGGEIGVDLTEERRGGDKAAEIVEWLRNKEGLLVSLKLILSGEQGPKVFLGDACMHFFPWTPGPEWDGTAAKAAALKAKDSIQPSVNLAGNNGR